MKIHTSLVFILAFFQLNAQQKEISLLGDRFSFRFPMSAELVLHPPDSLPEDPTKSKISMVIHDEGKESILFLAKELNQKSPIDPEQTLIVDSKSQFDSRILSRQDSVLIILQTFKRHELMGNMFPLNRLLIKNADNTLSEVTAYSSTPITSKLQEFEKFAENVFSTIRIGRRKISLDERTETYSILDTKSKIKIKVPSGFCVYVDKQTDYEVYTVSKFLEFGKNSVSTLTIYFGYQAKSIAAWHGILEAELPSTIQEFMFQKTGWDNFDFKDGKRSRRLREQIFVDDDIKKGMGIHVSIFGESEEDINEMSGIVKDILLVYDK